jgi:hypothetical protein
MPLSISVRRDNRMQVVAVDEDGLSLGIVSFVVSQWVGRAGERSSPGVELLS